MTSRIRAAVLAVLVIAAGLVWVQQASAAQPNVIRVPGPVAQTSASASKTATAKCPDGMKVVGGGAEIFVNVGVVSNKLVLTDLIPKSDKVSGFEGYTAAAAQSSGGTSDPWGLRVFAMCSDPLPGLQIIAAGTGSDSQPTKEAIAFCPANQRVIGSGGRVSTSAGQVHLQVARPSGPGDIVRAQGREDADGHSGVWATTAFAICVNTPAQYKVQFGDSPQRNSESLKAASVTCPSGLRRFGTGAAISNVAPGNVGLQTVAPFGNTDGGAAIAVEVTPTNVNWDFIVASAVCAAF
jgi:hypothetical protein